MNSLLDRALKYRTSRRGFLGLTAAGVATAALVGEQLVPAWPERRQASAETEGKWVTAACWHNCGGRCLNKALVKDGMVIRQKTDDTHPDSPDYPQQRACARGRSQRQQVLGADRLKYPMKRKHWEPGGGNKELRGRDEWVRISWDEALDIVASEIKRIKEKYGNESIMAFGSEIGRTLSLYGGYVSVWGSTSYGTWLETGPRIGLSSGNHVNDRMDMRKTQLLILWGANPAWSSAGLPTYNYLQVKKAGARVITIDPLFNETARVLADEWIPIRPGTDHALALGLAHTLLVEDDPETNPLIDWDFLHRCTVGFDKDHMPPGADPKENFKDYLLGTYDGQPKDAEWASEICGVKADRIRQLAREIGGTERVSLLVSWAPARGNNLDSWPQALMALGAMSGHMGRPGSMTGVCTHSGASNNGPSLVRAGGNGLPNIANPVKLRLNHNEHWTAVLEGKYMAGKGPGVTEPVNIQMIYHAGSSALNQKPGLVRGVAAHRKVEFVVAHHYALNTSAKYADVVLPITTEWERAGTLLSGNREILIWAQHVIDPLFEAKSDMWIAVELAKRLGLNAEEVCPISEEQQLFNRLAGAQVLKEDGKTWEKLLTITAEDIAEMGVEGEPQTGRITLAEFREKGIYQVPRRPGDNYEYVHLAEFRQDPEKHPLNTTSGKLEIYCQAIADHVRNCGWSEISPIPKYNRPTEGYEDTFADWEKKVKGDYPLQLYTIHYPRRSHSVFDNVPWLREAFPQEFIMNPVDAEARGIKDGDIVKISSRHGTVIRPVYLTERIMPGVVTLGEGAWADIDDETGIDKAGATNTLNGAIPTGQGHAGWNTCNVQVERYDGPLPPDHTWPQRVIF